MKINSMKLTIIIGLLLFLGGTMAGLFFRSIPVGNGDVIYMFVGILLGILSHSISGMFKKE
ncbi:hypothetical protein KAR91_62910 [Candidatus Pacearchaeota archaeon]|nr:hypothetical protein [Candidatus Pacearchaeota archaeon]